ncbi:MAG: 30S ribosomal protein S6 [bacterium]
MIRYETLMLLRSEATGDEISKIEQGIDKILVDSKGRINTFDPWGKCRLAYPVQKNDYGIYILTRYEIPKESLNSFFKQLHNLLKIKFNDVVLRHVDVNLQSNSSIDYSKPEALEAPRVGNLDSFLKENKMESFLSQPKERKEINDEINKEDKESKNEEKIEVEIEALRQASSYVPRNSGTSEDKQDDREKKDEVIESEADEEITEN